MTDGAVDSTFTIGTGASETVYSIALQPDGKILVGGVFTSWNGAAANRLARLNPDGTVDSTFTAGVTYEPAANSSVPVFQSDGKIIIFGESGYGDNTQSVFRLNADGSVDSTFSCPVRTLSLWTGASLAVQPDGKILVGGMAFSLNGRWPFLGSVFRLNADGSVDSSFSSTVDDGLSRLLHLDSAGRITYVSGSGNVYRLDHEGSLDSTFTFTLDPLSASHDCAAIQPDGKILVAGAFYPSGFSGAPAYRVRRLNPDGTVDSTFTIGTGPSDMVNSIAVQPDGKILVGGSFTSWNGAAANRLARLNPDGTVDSTFTIGTGGDSVVNSIAVQPDGKILVGGNFTSWNSAAANRLARLNGTPPPPPPPPPVPAVSRSIRSFTLLPDFMQAADNGEVLKHFMDAGSVSLDTAADLLTVADPGTSPSGTCELANPQAIRREWLGWLAWLTGVDIAGATTQQARDLVGQADKVQRRGTRNSILAAVQRTLSTQTPPPRVFANLSGFEPYLITIVTSTAQTPDATATLLAALSEKPAGMVIEVQVVDGSLAMDIRHRFATIAELEDEFALVSDLESWNPQA